MSARNRRLSLGTIESGVTRLLVSTKHLLESLTQWANKEADDKFVSDAYVKLGNDFRAAVRAFNGAGVDVSDLGDVPHELRKILESALLEPPSQESLDRFLPSIRNIIVTLLQSLKTKQIKLKELAVQRERELAREQSRDPSRDLSRDLSRDHSREISKDHSRDNTRDLLSRDQTREQFRVSSSNSSYPTDLNSVFRSDSTASTSTSTSTSASVSASRSLSNASTSSSSRHRSTTSKPSVSPTVIVELASPVKSTQLRSDAEIPPRKTPSPVKEASSKDLSVPTSNGTDSSEDPNKFKYKRNSGEALLQLQKGNSMQRRASKRFLAYQYAKLGAAHSPNLPQIEASAPPSPNKMGKSPRASQIIDQNSLFAQEEDTSVIITKPENQENHIFLRLGNRTKKCPVTLPVSFNALRLLFVEKFAYSPGVDAFPEIYIQDVQSKIFYELDEFSIPQEVKDGSLLQLNGVVGDDSIGKLDTKIDKLCQLIETLTVSLRDTSDQIVTTVKEELEKQSVVFEQIKSTSSIPKIRNPSLVAKSGEKIILTIELNKLTQEVEVLRQMQINQKRSIQTAISRATETISSLQLLSLANPSSNRSYMDNCHNKLSSESDMLLTKVDDLQDVLEALRKDVAQRGVRVSESQLKLTNREIEEVKSSLKLMQNYIAVEKPSWKKIWENELDVVCEEQQFFNLQDDLTKDLDDDIRKIEETFELIEQCLMEQSKSQGSKARRFIAPIPEPGESLHLMKDAVLSQVAALVPNHGSRVEAIERAERLREREKELMNVDEFQAELGEYVDDAKLKKLGGIEELERMRKLKDEENLKSSFGAVV